MDLLCPCSSGRIQYLPLENHRAQNITACKSQGKYHELSDHWKSVTINLLSMLIHGQIKLTKSVESNECYNI